MSGVLREYALKVAEERRDPVYTLHFSKEAAEAAYRLRVTREPLIAIQALATIEGETRKILFEMVSEARNDGASWNDIAEALGISRQAAQARFGNKSR